MCITASVGPGARNNIDDVSVVQILLNLNRGRFAGTPPPELEPDGRIGRNTLGAIAAFETGVMGLAASDSLVAPGDATLKALLAGLEPGPTKDKLAIVLPHATRSRIDLYFEPLKAGMVKYGITSPLQMAHFIAQIGHESGSFLYSEEIASGAAYEGRKDLGNTQPGDGKRFKGRGLIQLTGRANYTAYGNFNGKDYLDDPTPLATDPALSVDAACWYWAVLRNIGPHADADDVKTVSKKINGGPPINGLDDRIANLNRAKAVLGLT